MSYPTFATRTHEFPTLPSILPQFKPYVFTHRSYHFHKNATINPDDRLLDYDRLEFLGEGVLQAALSLFLYRNYQHHRSGLLKTIKSQLSTRDRLAQFSDTYGLVEQIRVDPGSEDNIRSSRDVRAHVFKAYIGAVLLSHSFDVVVTWVDQLMQWSSVNNTTPSGSSAIATAVSPSVPTPSELSPIHNTPYAAPGGPTRGGSLLPERKSSAPTSPHGSFHRTAGSISSISAYSSPSPSTYGSSLTSISTTRTTPNYAGTRLQLKEFDRESDALGSSLLDSLNGNDDDPPTRTRGGPAIFNDLMDPIGRGGYDPIQVQASLTGLSLGGSGGPTPTRSRSTVFGQHAPPYGNSRYPVFTPGLSPSSRSSTLSSSQSPGPTHTSFSLGSTLEDLEEVTTFGTVEKFNERCHQRFIKPEWVFSNVGDSLFNKWQAIVKVKGEEKGRGIGKSKQVAKELAARKAMKAMLW